MTITTNPIDKALEALEAAKFEDDQTGDYVVMLEQVKPILDELMASFEKQAAEILGRKGGLSTSTEKSKASRANGRKGGRPKKAKDQGQVNR